MPRGKTAMRLVESARARAVRCSKRAKGLQKKAAELATLCAVPVALVCAGATSALVWESEEGVLDRYRRAVPPETRAQHTHRGYLETELAKERAKLARARHGCPAALKDWDAALNDVTLDEARELLRVIDAALRAAGDRMEALGLPDDAGHGPLDDQVPLGASEDAVMPQQLGHGGGLLCTESNPVDMGAAGFQPQTVPFHGGNDDGLLDQFSWDDRFQVQPGCGFQCMGGSSNAVDETLERGSGNADYDWPDLTMWHTDELCDSALTLGYYPDFADGTVAPEYSAQAVAGGDYMNTLQTGYGCPMAMDVGDNCTNLDSNYTVHWQAEEFHCSDTRTSQLLSAASSLQPLDPGFPGHAAPGRRGRKLLLSEEMQS